MKKGWYRLFNAKKWHYFVEGSNTSLCGRWLIFALATADLEDSNHDSTSNCAACNRKRIKAYPS